MKRVLLVLSAVLSITALASFADAATVGSWSKTCVARNSITGIPEPVAEMNINDPSLGFFAFTSKLPNGGWLTRYNLALAQTVPSDVLIFLFYHECAHAQVPTASEAVADCVGLRSMQSDMTVTPAMIADITRAYAARGRPFPSGPCN